MRSAPLWAFEELQLTREERAPTAAAHTRPKLETQTAALCGLEYFDDNQWAFLGNLARKTRKHFNLKRCSVISS